MAATEQRRRGRPAMGDRKFIGFRTATSRAEVLEEAAKAEGITMNKLVEELLDIGYRHWAPGHHERLNGQEELPIGRIA
ncbi:hypothetical protein [Arthrobacter mobilis]|uniref:Uncharacterized protein n=1 Tax=Arthrobacter mobilis TaxID=2724944 RepID=A0A7X6HGR9_9MICC|nr:hypothetical protein [Arthrobacter mobilis]NKX55934.1 hypothetical protein [Arthrobacter mobilis]